MNRQTSIFDFLPPVPDTPKITYVYDASWDEEIAPQQCKSVGGQVAADTCTLLNNDSTVGGQVLNQTQQPAPTVQLKIAPQHTHWLEQYDVTRCKKKYYYWRYCWMEGRKIKRQYIGSIHSGAAKEKYQEVKIAIGRGDSPTQIVDYIKH